PGSRGAGLRCVVGLAAATAARADVGSSMRRGLALEAQGRFADAAKAYQEALVLEPDNVRIRYDLGRALYQQGQMPEAADHFQLGILSKDKTFRARSLYNLANTQFKQKQLDDAIATYTEALLQNPHDLDAKENLEYCGRRKSQAKDQKPDSTTQQPKRQPQQQPRPQPQPQQAQAQPQPKGAIGKDQADRMLQ